MAHEVFGGLVAEEFHGVSAFDQCDAFGREAFQLDRADSRSRPARAGYAVAPARCVEFRSMRSLAR